MAKLKLWIAPGACSLAPHILLLDVGAEFELVAVDVEKGFPEEHRHVNPKMRVPILQFEDGSVLTEVPAIMTAISQISPGKNVLGRTEMEVNRTYEWFNWLSGTLHTQAFGGFLRPQRFVKDPALYDAVREKGRETISQCFDQIDEKLHGRYAVGDSFTAVDPYLFVFYRWGNRMGIPMATRYPNYSKFVLNLATRASVQEALEREGISILGGRDIADTDNSNSRNSPEGRS